MRYSLTFLLLLLIFIPDKFIIADELSKIKKDLDSSDWKIRLSAVEKLSERTDNEAVELLIKVAGTRSEYWPVKIKAIKLLGMTKNPKVKKLLLSIFNDPFLNWECPAIKSYTATALGNFSDDEEVINALINSLDDKERLTVYAAIRALGKTRSTKVIPYIVKHIDDKSFAIRLSVIEALNDIGDPEARIYLEEIAKNDSDRFIRSIATEALNNINKKSKH